MEEESHKCYSDQNKEAHNMWLYLYEVQEINEEKRNRMAIFLLEKNQRDNVIGKEIKLGVCYISV